jgi:hypothetical protein
LAAIGLVGLSLIDLVAGHSDLNPSAPAALYRHRPELADRLPPSSRVYVYDYHLTDRALRYLGRAVAYLPKRIPRSWSFAEGRALALQAYFVPSTAGRFGARGAFEIDYHGLYSPWLQKLTVLLRQAEASPTHLRLLQLGGVDYVVALHRAGFEDLAPFAQIDSFLTDPVRVFSVPATLERSFAVGGARIAAGADPVQVLLAPELDPRKEVLLDAGEEVVAPPRFSGRSRIVEERADRLRLEAELSSPGWAVLLDSYDDGWHASVDGKGQLSLRANLLFRAVRVPAGQHVIEWRYRPRGLVAGLTLAVATAVAAATALAAFVICRRRLRLVQPAPPPSP